MGPLSPDLIGNGLNLVVAVLLGMAFGFVLEQAGFSSSRKLAGLFYGYDFVVLRVFFTAAITAMAGIFMFAYLGWINLDIIYINPLFIRSAIIGGAIMGLGFILGGFCPGTSMCAAAIGKIDAMFFVAGIFIGVFIFGEMYPLVSSVLMADSLGDLPVYEALGMSRGLFASILVAFALIAFAAVGIVERKVNKQPLPSYFKLNTRTISWVTVIILGITLNFFPDIKTRAFASIDDDKFDEEATELVEMDIDELAYRVVEQDRKYIVVDVRSVDEYKASHIPFSINIPLENLADGAWRDIFKDRKKTAVFYGYNKNQAVKAGMVSRFLKDKTQIRILNVPFEDFAKIYMSDNGQPVEESKSDAEITRFRTRARTDMILLAEQETSKPVIVVKKRKVQGGC